jgi:CRISPR-associated protein (TIGR03986 family)
MKKIQVRHLDEVSDQRMTTAPYNFIPLPEKPFLIEAKDLNFAQWFGDMANDYLCGIIRYDAVCLSPLYTRAAVSPDSSSDLDDRDFYHHCDPLRPFLPGSSVRGMVRAMVTLLSYGKLPRTKHRRLYMRSFGSDVLARNYVARMVENIRRLSGPKGNYQAFKSRSQSGFLRQMSSGDWEILPCYQLRVRHQALMNAGMGSIHIPKPGGRIRFANPSLQYKEVWVKAAKPEPDWIFHRAISGGGMYTWGRAVDEISSTERAGWLKGWLVISGPMDKKKAEFVFVENRTAKPIRVDEQIIKEVNDEFDQVTQYQELAFPPDGKLNLKLAKENRLPGLPVWYIEENNKVAGLGRTQNFRLPYPQYTDKYIPNDRETEECDLAEAIFGRVREKGSEDDDQIRGRVRFEDAACIAEKPFLSSLPDDRARRGDRVPQILSLPKPSSFQNYLCQSSDDKLRLLHYGSGVEDTEIRGTKLYWHRNKQGANGSREQLKENEIFTAKSQPEGTQQTAIRPVAKGTQFSGMIRFDNLSPIELGALLAAIDLPEGMAHRFGMGKPLGLGSLQLTNIRIEFIDRKERYSGWDKTGQVSEEQGLKHVEKSREAFRVKMVDHTNLQESLPRCPDDIAFWNMPLPKLIGMMLSWKNAPPEERTRYIGLDIKSEQLMWRHRYVLPGLHQVLGLANPLSSISPMPCQTTNELFGIQPLQVVGVSVEKIISRHAGSGREFETINVPPSHTLRPGDMIEARLDKSHSNLASFIRLIELIQPDAKAPDTRCLARIVSGGPGSWKVRLEGGTDVWLLQGSPPPGTKPAIGETVSVRIVNRGDLRMVFAMD